MARVFFFRLPAGETCVPDHAGITPARRNTLQSVSKMSGRPKSNRFVALAHFELCLVTEESPRDGVARVKRRPGWVGSKKQTDVGIGTACHWEQRCRPCMAEFGRVHKVDGFLRALLIVRSASGGSHCNAAQKGLTLDLLVKSDL